MFFSVRTTKARVPPFVFRGPYCFIIFFLWWKKVWFFCSVVQGVYPPHSLWSDILFFLKPFKGLCIIKSEEIIKLESDQMQCLFFLNFQPLFMLQLVSWKRFLLIIFNQSYIPIPHYTGVTDIWKHEDNRKFTFEMCLGKPQHFFFLMAGVKRLSLIKNTFFWDFLKICWKISNCN